MNKSLTRQLFAINIFKNITPTKMIKINTIEKMSKSSCSKVHHYLLYIYIYKKFMFYFLTCITY